MTSKWIKVWFIKFAINLGYKIKLLRGLNNYINVLKKEIVVVNNILRNPKKKEKASMLLNYDLYPVKPKVDHFLLSK